MLNVKKINYDEEYELGCETCDFGSSYISEIEIILEDNKNIKIKTNQMYDYMIRKSDYMELIANSDKVEEFIMKTIKKIKEDNIISWEGICEIKIDNKKIDIAKAIAFGSIEYGIV